MANDLQADLCELVARRKVLVIVGSGVSIAATRNAPAASWVGLLKLGVARCRMLNPGLDAEWERRLVGEIESGDLDDTLSAAEKISRKLQAPTGGEFRRWLRETVGALQVGDAAVLEALRDLQLPLATTNYDDLLERVTQLPTASWRDQGKAFRFVRREERSIFHLHGHWDDPESVVLGIRSYEQVRDDAYLQALRKALAMTESLLFVGCGDGLSDPNFKPFLTWLREVNPGNAARHYRLALEQDVAALQKQHPPEERIVVLPYGREHAALAGFLRSLGAVAKDQVRPNQEPGLTAIPAPTATFSTAIIEYLRRLEAATSKLQLIGLGQGVQIELPIQQAYIPLNVVISRDLKHENLCHFDEKALGQREHVEENVLLGDIFKWAGKYESRGVLLLGDPGAGKTTGARQFCWRVLEERDLPKNLGLPAGTVPVFLRLRNITHHHLSHKAGGLQAFITDSVAASALPPDLANPGPDLLVRRGVLWVFDGLDEVVNENARVHVCGWIKQARAERPDDFFLVTSRYQGYQGRVDLGPAFCQFHVKPLNESQVAEFVDHWYRAVCRKLHGPGDATEERAVSLAGSLIELLQQSEYRIGRLRELPANPLLLTILCVVYHQDRSLPRRRADLYAKCVRVLVEHWRKEVRELQEVADFDPEAAEGVLAAAAWWLHEEEGRVTQSVEELGSVATRALADLAPGAGLGRDGEAFIRRMRDESGILAMWSAGQCGFLHRTFQEYLAGLHAAREGKAGELVKHIGQSWWREVILVAVALGPREFAKAFFTKVLETNCVENDAVFVRQCLEEARYAVLDPFLDALRLAPADSFRESAIRRCVAAFDRRPEVVGRTDTDQTPRLVDPKLDVSLLNGGSMLLNTPGQLVLRVVNRGTESLPRQTLQIQPSAEYEVESENPVVLHDASPNVPHDIAFTIRAKFVQRITVNYLLNGVLRAQPLYINVIMDNPYVYGNPIGSSDAFFGRCNELEDIVQAVSKPNKQDILLVGERRTGKSSLLFQLQARLQLPFFPVYIVLNEASPTVEAVIELVCHKMCTALAEADILQSPIPAQHTYQRPHFSDAVGELLAAARRSRPGLRVVLLLDEADFILKVDDQLQNVLRSTLQSRGAGPYLRAVVAGTTDLSIYVSQRSSPFFNHFRFVTLKPLTEPETRDLIFKPAAALSYRYEPTAIDAILRASGGHPYYCQRICYEAFALAERERADLVTVDRALRAVMLVRDAADAYHGFATGFWTPSPPREPLSREEAAFLKALAAAEGPLSGKAQAVKRLVDWQLISSVGAGYSFTAELFREWTLRAMQNE